MHIIAKKEFLSKIVARIQSAVLEKATNHLALKTEDGVLTSICYDNVLAVECVYRVEQFSEGTVFVPGKYFSDIVRQLPEGDVRLIVSGSSLVVTNRSPEDLYSDKEGYMFSIPLMDQLAWKKIPEIKSFNSVFLSSAKLRYMTSQVLFCIDTNSSRAFAKVAYLHRSSERNLRLVATDSYRLSFCDVEVEDLPADFLPSGICLAKRTLLEIQKACDEGLEFLGLTIAEDMKSLVITGEDFKIFSRIVALQFPKYERVLPTGTLSQVDFFTNRLSSSARRVLLASDKKANVVKFSFHDSGLTLSARNEVSSESKETVVLEGKDFSNSEFAINGIYLSEICSVVESEKLEFRYRSYKDPVLVTPKTEPLGCKSLHLVIPIDQSASREAGT